MWNNSNILYRKQTLFFWDYIDSGFSLDKDILENDTIMTLKTICEKVGHKPTWLFEYGAMRTAIEACAAKRPPSYLQITMLSQYSDPGNFVCTWWKRVGPNQLQ